MAAAEESIEYTIATSSREEGVVIVADYSFPPPPRPPSSASSSSRPPSAAARASSSPFPSPSAGGDASSSHRRARSLKEAIDDGGERERGDSPFDEAAADDGKSDNRSRGRNFPSTKVGGGGSGRGGGGAGGGGHPGITYVGTEGSAYSADCFATSAGGEAGGGKSNAGANGSSEEGDGTTLLQKLDAVAVANGTLAPDAQWSHDGRAAPLPPSAVAGPTYYTSRPKRRRFLPRGLNLSLRLREYRHARCLMTPLSSLVLFAIALSSALGLLLAAPQFFVGLLLGPLVRRNYWLVEFLYRHEVARWGHVKIMEAAGRAGGGSQGKRDKRGKAKKKWTGHSQTLHQREVVVPDRVWIHPVPQFVDNVAYLVVCAPPPSAKSLPLAGVLIDCGDSDAALDIVDRIYERHYARNHPRSDEDRERGAGGIEICAVLCTHRHHDHTAGVKGLKATLEERRGGARGWSVAAGAAASKGAGDGGEEGDEMGDDGDDVYARATGDLLVVGGAVEDVPHCDLYVKNGCFVPLPCLAGGGAVNDLNEVVSVEAIGVPSHTRGSVVYALRNRTAPGLDLVVPRGSGAERGAEEEEPLRGHLFTGDAVFSGGGGVPFESDLEFKRDDFVKNPNKLKKKHGSSKFRPGAGQLSMERCFAEVLVRAEGPWATESTSAGGSGKSPPQDAARASSGRAPPVPRILLYPGHEYAKDLLLRQFDPRATLPEGHWTRLSPATYFETASSYFVGAHRRALPPGQKLLNLPVSLERERATNPNFRSLRRRGEHAVHALRLWYEHGARELIPCAPEADANGEGGTAAVVVPQVPGLNDSSATRILYHSRMQYLKVFTTVYSADLDKVVRDLRDGKVAPAAAADRLASLTRRLDEPAIGRRPIPGTLQSHKNVYLGVVALAVLGSPPSAVAPSDANAMGLAPPVASTDRISISRSRLVAALDGLGLISGDESPKLRDVVALLWKEARRDGDLTLDVESAEDDDALELGLLKLALFGVSYERPSKFCLPCGGGFGGGSKPRYDEASWTVKGKLRRTGGELIRHDAEACPLCRDAATADGGRCPHRSGGATASAIASR
ncbi:hypothetical protein ACHAWF_014820 [Thalassiosira exigua]